MSPKGSTSGPKKKRVLSQDEENIEGVVANNTVDPTNDDEATPSSKRAKLEEGALPPEDSVATNDNTVVGDQVVVVPTPNGAGTAGISMVTNVFPGAKQEEAHHVEPEETTSPAMLSPMDPAIAAAVTAAIEPTSITDAAHNATGPIDATQTSTVDTNGTLGVVETAAIPPVATTIVNKSTRLSWEDRLRQLQEYKDAHGDCLVPTRYKENKSLGKWVHNQREQYKLFHHKTKEGYKKKCSMTVERIQQLEEIGFVWSTQRQKKANEDWQARFEQLKAFKAKHGHTLVPHGYKEDPSFAEWIHRQRTTYHTTIGKYLGKEEEEAKKDDQGKAKASATTAEATTAASTTATTTDTAVEAAVAAADTTKTTDADAATTSDASAVTKAADAVIATTAPAEGGTTADGKKVDGGVTSTETKEEEKPSEASAKVDGEEKTVAESGKGEEEDSKADQPTNDAIVPDIPNVDPKIKARMDQLASIGFVFTVQTDNWNVRLSELREFQKDKGHCQVPTHFATNKPLGRWVHTQRHQYRLYLKNKKSCMTDERIALLNQLGFNWEVRPSLETPRVTWQSRFDELVDFQKKNGHLNVPSHEPHNLLYKWTLEQKQRLKLLSKNNGEDVTKRMGPDRVKALKSIGFIAEELSTSAMTSAGANSDTTNGAVDATNTGTSNVATAATTTTTTTTTSGENNNNQGEDSTHNAPATAEVTVTTTNEVAKSSTGEHNAPEAAGKVQVEI